MRASRYPLARFPGDDQHDGGQQPGPPLAGSQRGRAQQPVEEVRLGDEEGSGDLGRELSGSSWSC